jgi:hypothetical protein
MALAYVPRGGAAPRGVPRPSCPGSSAVRLLSRALLVAAALATLMADLAAGSAHGQAASRSPTADPVGGPPAMAAGRRPWLRLRSHDQRFWSGLSCRCLMRAESFAALKRCHLVLPPCASNATRNP